MKVSTYKLDGGSLDGTPVPVKVETIDEAGDAALDSCLRADNPHQLAAFLLEVEDRLVRVAKGAEASYRESPRAKSLRKEAAALRAAADPEKLGGLAPEARLALLRKARQIDPRTWLAAVSF